MCTGIIQTRVPNSSPNWLAILLLTVMFAVQVQVAGQDASLMVRAHARPAACHQHDGAGPIPQPVSYQCCQSGHDTAILQSSAASHLDHFYLTVPDERDHIFAPCSSVRSPSTLATSSAGPPNLTPLRV